jgi:hypothetical protein
MGEFLREIKEIGASDKTNTRFHVTLAVGDRRFVSADAGRGVDWAEGSHGRLEL